MFLAIVRENICYKWLQFTTVTMRIIRAQIRGIGYHDF